MNFLKHILRGFIDPVGASVATAKDAKMSVAGKASTIAYIWGCHQEPEEQTPLERLQEAINDPDR
jgi:flavorubredoxin